MFPRRFIRLLNSKTVFWNMLEDPGFFDSRERSEPAQDIRPSRDRLFRELHTRLFAHQFPYEFEFPKAWDDRIDDVRPPVTKSQLFKFSCQFYITSLINWPPKYRTLEPYDWRIFLVPMIDAKYAGLYVLSILANRSRHISDDMHHIWRRLRTDLEVTALMKESWDRICDEEQNGPLPFSQLDQPLFQIDHDYAMRFAKRVEVLIRDEQQLEVGRLSLQESKKAIEQANLSIREGKRMKMSE